MKRFNKYDIVAGRPSADFEFRIGFYGAHAPQLHCKVLSAGKPIKENCAAATIRRATKKERRELLGAIENRLGIVYVPVLRCWILWPWETKRCKDWQEKTGAAQVVWENKNFHKNDFLNTRYAAEKERAYRDSMEHYELLFPSGRRVIPDKDGGL